MPSGIWTTNCSSDNSFTHKSLNVALMRNSYDSLAPLGNCSHVVKLHACDIAWSLKTLEPAHVRAGRAHGVQHSDRQRLAGRAADCAQCAAADDQHRDQARHAGAAGARAMLCPALARPCMPPCTVLDSLCSHACADFFMRFHSIAWLAFFMHYIICHIARYFTQVIVTDTTILAKAGPPLVVHGERAGGRVRFG